MPEYDNLAVVTLLDAIKTALGDNADTLSATPEGQHALETLKTAQRFINDIDEQIDQAERVNNEQGFALAYLASCTAATADGMLSRKSTPKYELERNKRICEMLLRAMRGEHVSDRVAHSTIAGAEDRLTRVIGELGKAGA